MTAHFQYNRKWIGWLLALVLIVMAMPSGASWHCLDGKPCDANCKMWQSATLHTSSPVVSAEPHCSHCLPGSANIQRAMHSGKAVCSCTTPQCVLQVSESPASALQEGVKFFTPLLALPPPVFTVTSVEIETVSVPTPRLCFYPQRFLRPHGGRAPPTRL